jgi:hypothetical protein
MTTFVLIDHARRKCEREHELNGGRWCGVHIGNGEIVVRTEDKAGRLCRKHPDCKIVCAVPEFTEVGA